MLGDAVTASRIKDYLEKVATNADLAVTRKAVQKNLREILLTRADSERKYDWETLWRIPVSNAIEAELPKTGQRYVFLLKEAARGLNK